jgi:hypothetical protein
VYEIFVTKPEGMRPRGRPRRSWEGIIKISCGNSVRGRGLDSSGSDRNRRRFLEVRVINFGFRKARKMS